MRKRTLDKQNQEHCDHRHHDRHNDRLRGYERLAHGQAHGDANENVILGAPEADQYIQEMYKLTSGDPATQAEIYADAESAAQLTPGPSTKLRYALVLATPGHSGSNPQEAQGLFRELLAATELMTPAETALATIHLKSVEQQIVLGAPTKRLRVREHTRRHHRGRSDRTAHRNGRVREQTTETPTSRKPSKNSRRSPRSNDRSANSRNSDNDEPQN